MVRDIELDRLRSAQDVAYQRKQKSWGDQEAAWQLYQEYKARLTRAHEARQEAYAVQKQVRQGHKTLNGSFLPRINALEVRLDILSGQSVRYRQVLGDAKHQLNMELITAQLRDIDRQIDASKERCVLASRSFRNSKHRYAEVRAEYEEVKTEYENARNAFEQAKLAFEQAKDAVAIRLIQIKEESRRRQDNRRFIAEFAGVPAKYIDDTCMSVQPDGTVNIYFGGEGKPSGPGHGHYVMDASGEVTYRRDPLSPHGVHNFTAAGLKKLSSIVRCAVAPKPMAFANA